MENLIEVLVIVILTIVNGLFSMSETALVSARKARLQQRASSGNEGARAALALAEHPDRFLSTVQIGITLIGILAGAFGGAGLSQRLQVTLEGLNVPPEYSKGLAFGLVVAGITYLSLVIGELVPKRLALNNAEGIAAAMAKPMSFISRITTPVVALLSASTNGVVRLMGLKPSTDPPITEDEIRILIAQGRQAGVFEEAEQEIVERVFRLGDRRAANLMTPRSEMLWLDVEDPIEVTWRKVAEANHSAFPLCEGSLDKILGVVPLKQLWSRSPDEQPRDWNVDDLKAAAVEPLVVIESTRAFKLLDLFKGGGQHLALVVDEYGGIIGLVTLHDVLEALVGEVPTAGQAHDAEAVQREDGSWLLDGMLPVEELLRLLDLTQLPDDAEEYNTLGGFVMARLGRIPDLGNHFEWSGLRFEVVDMDGNRVDRVLVTPVPG